MLTDIVSRRTRDAQIIHRHPAQVVFHIRRFTCNTVESSAADFLDPTGFRRVYGWNDERLRDYSEIPDDLWPFWYAFKKTGFLICGQMKDKV